MKAIKLAIVAIIMVELLAVAVPIINHSDAKPELDVYIIAGQSNTYPKINTDASTASPIPDEGAGFYFGTETDPTYNKSFDLSSCQMWDINNNGVARIGGLFPSFASEYSDKTGHSVYLIDTGLSGQPIATFLPEGYNYDWPGQVIDAAIKQIPSTYDVNICGYIWIQGEGDKNNPSQTYEVNMIRLYDIYSGGELSVKLPICYICKVRDAQGGNAAIAQTWLVDNKIKGFEMASTLPDTFTTANGLLGSDELHYTQNGFNVLGVDLADNISKGVVTSAPADYTEIMLVIIPVTIAAFIVVCLRSEMKRD